MTNFGSSPLSVSISNISKHYGSRQVLKNISMDVEPATFVVMLGPSGSGKTTLLRIIAGIERPSHGEVRIGDQLVVSKGVFVSPEKRSLAMVFQDYALWPHLNARENVIFALKRLKINSREEKYLAAEMLEKVGLSDRSENYPSELSGGEQQRVALARALVAKPGLLLLDEPLSNLDTDLRERLRVLISTLARDVGTTVISITHDQSEAFALADTVGVLNEGELIQMDVPEAIHHEPISPFVASFTGIAGHLKGVASRNISGNIWSVKVGDFEVIGHAREEIFPESIVLAAFRPDSVSIEGEIEKATGSGMHIVGVVADVAYRGSGYDHVVDCLIDDQPRLHGLHSNNRFERGSRIKLSFNPRGCHIFTQLQDIKEEFAWVR